MTCLVDASGRAMFRMYNRRWRGAGAACAVAVAGRGGGQRRRRGYAAGWGRWRQAGDDGRN